MSASTSLYASVRVICWNLLSNYLGTLLYAIMIDISIFGFSLSSDFFLSMLLNYFT